MSNQQNKSVLTQDLTHLKNIKSILNSAHDAVSLRAECFEGLGVLFDSIRREVHPNSHEGGLTKLGLYLTNDYSDLCNSSKQEINDALEALKQLLSEVNA